MTQETMTKEQTAVEWLIEELKSYGQYQVVGLYQSIFQLAKERELKQLSAERERAWKLVEAAKYVLLFAEKDGWIVNGYRSKECVLELQQTLNEYDTATKES